jgi:hypothetical protein
MKDTGTPILLDLDFFIFQNKTPLVARRSSFRLLALFRLCFKHFFVAMGSLIRFLRPPFYRAIPLV